MSGDVFMPHDRPLTLSKDEFVAVLTDLLAWVQQDDSMEGSLAYEWGDQPGEYRVAGVLRMGNSMGQGGVRLLQEQAA
jgi:hypothetical protein